MDTISSLSQAFLGVPSQIDTPKTDLEVLIFILVISLTAVHNLPCPFQHPSSKSWSPAPRPGRQPPALCACVRLCVFVHVRVFVPVCLPVWVCACMCLCVGVRMHECLCVCGRVHLWGSVCVCVCMLCVRLCVSMRVCTSC